MPYVKEYWLAFSKSIELECQCGERLFLMGLEKDWRVGRRRTFRCSRCGAKLSIERSARKSFVGQLGA